MRLARVKVEDRELIAVETRAGFVEATSAVEDASVDVIKFLECPDRFLPEIEDKIAGGKTLVSIPGTDIEYLTPIARPGKIICLGLNYAAHAAEGGFTPPDYPTLFMRAASSLTPHTGVISLPACSSKLDYEGELAVIIGRTAFQVSEEDALDYVAGYSIFNDATIRDYQKKTSQWTIGKNFDSTGAFGPLLVTPDELPEGASGLRISTALNGLIMQDDNTDSMIFSVARTIAILTECLTLEPGDVIAMGTPEGVGYVRKPPVYMKDGDECTIQIEGIGSLTNRIRRTDDRRSRVADQGRLPRRERRGRRPALLSASSPVFEALRD